ncbi:hypothetical protein XU18_3099 [Perkinsela sp. CCAP 1560/4]|nr:hypothetical protein XU18_3099 [Perkinsela sp. CCAP 1560/4]|eukprot:KNH05937.1 hypothetical protein XU18_3099 [Perkinsela sp. CCAP 1560/4]
MATEHAFLVNCLHCGRILCEKESAEVCFACGSDPRTTPGSDNPVAVFFENETHTDSQNGATGDASQDTEAFERAIKNQNEMLLRQQRKDEMLKVYDEDSDYFATTAWTTAEAREACLRARMEDLKRQQARLDPSTYQIQLDLMNRTIAVCSNIQSSLGGRPPSTREPVDEVSSPEKISQTLAERAAQRALVRLELVRNMRIVEDVHASTDDAQLEASNEEDPHAQSVGRNPNLNTSIAPRYVFTPEEQSAPKWASASEVRATEGKFRSLQARKKVLVESIIDP